MSTAAASRSYPRYDPVHLIGVVMHVGDDGCVVDCDGRAWRCVRAASCLLAPAVGDTVLVSGPDSSRVFLIAVIAQADPASARIELPGDVVIAAPDGDLTLESGGRTQLNGRTRVQVQAAAFGLQAADADCRVERMRYAGAEVKGSVGMLRLAGKVCETAVDRLVQLSRNVFRITEESEHVRARVLDSQASQSARLHAPYTVVTGEELVKVDASQIHVG
ncbi:hypothetical protein CAL29_02530 [Bordetella genomosp. 10]|uniref:DUF3540 domain-containing protein n=1 Tax=Bordetella genomosp. 10 TaxID=1416804 RepID=A0A261SIT4_9BORD|nr:DUF3540 domain-containing protein [Bordetella genomosp. 10]OZI37316.1 hypothetical protein CAL29_02530 [Bordetella genomosp. 10]